MKKNIRGEANLRFEKSGSPFSKHNWVFLPLLHSRELTVGFNIFIYGSMYIFCFPGGLKYGSFILFNLRGN